VNLAERCAVRHGSGSRLWACVPLWSGETISREPALPGRRSGPTRPGHARDAARLLGAGGTHARGSAGPAPAICRPLELPCPTHGGRLAGRIEGARLPHTDLTQFPQGLGVREYLASLLTHKEASCPGLPLSGRGRLGRASAATRPRLPGGAGGAVLWNARPARVSAPPHAVLGEAGRACRLAPVDVIERFGACNAPRDLSRPA